MVRDISQEENIRRKHTIDIKVTSPANVSLLYLDLGGRQQIVAQK